jgi:hypothetical protein
VRHRPDGTWRRSASFEVRPNRRGSQRKRGPAFRTGGARVENRGWGACFAETPLAARTAARRALNSIPLGALVVRGRGESKLLPSGTIRQITRNRGRARLRTPGPR